jgi:hypothetical protein
MVRFVGLSAVPEGHSWRARHGCIVRTILTREDGLVGDKATASTVVRWSRSRSWRTAVAVIHGSSNVGRCIKGRYQTLPTAASIA